jgi:hypothetical protein
MFAWLGRWIGKAIANYLSKPATTYQPFSVQPTRTLRQYLRPGDILLVEGNLRVSSIIKYLTQSTWSHAALYIGDALGKPEEGKEAKVLIEADLQEGVIAVPLSLYENFNTRICRPIGIGDEDRRKVVDFMVAHLGMGYDLKNIVDLLRYLFPAPVPTRWRRKALALGSGSPTRAICSTLVAQAFHSVKYPIIPLRLGQTVYAYDHGQYTAQQILDRRHHSLYTPRDFDLSPYFQVVKPTVEAGFDYTQMVWQGDIPADFGPDRPTAGIK